MQKTESQPQKTKPSVEKSQPEQEQVPVEPAAQTLRQAKGLPTDPIIPPLRQTQVLQLQRTLGNRYVQRAVIQRRKEGGGDSALPDKAPEAASLVAGQYPQLRLPEDQLAILQKVLDARLEIMKGEEKLKKLNIYRGPGGWGGASDEVAKAERIKAGLSPHTEVVGRHQALFVPTETVLGDDILSQNKKDRPAEIAFRESLYKQLIGHNMALVINPGLEPKPLFSYQWGPDRWKFGHSDGGRIMFKNLMAIQTWNLAYEKVLLGEQIDILKDMLEISKSIGGQPVNATGKKLGETYGHVWNTTVKVGAEISPIGGYYDDPEGRAELSRAYLAARGARCVIRGPDNWLHIFALSAFRAYDMKGQINDDYVYLLTEGAEVKAERVTTSDGFELEMGTGPTGTGWRMEQILSEVEQFAIGAFFGDIIDDPGVSMSVGQIVIGCIPIVGQIADARDVAAGIYKMWQTGGKDGKLQTLLAMVGFIPLFGDGVKAAKEAFSKAGREAAKEVFAKTVRQGAPGAAESLAKQIIKDPDGVAQIFKISKEELSELSELASKAMKEGGEAAEKYAAKMAEHWQAVGGDAAALVTIGGGKWSNVAKSLATSPAGEALGKKMQAWRVQQFEGLEQRIKQKAGDFGQDITSAGAPQMARTGTPSYLSDVDVSFMGPHATVHRNAAIRQMEEQFGPGWRELLDADIFADPTRLHMFDQPLAELGGKAAREAEKRIVSEAELNVLAKMLQGGADPAQVAKTAKDLGVDMAAVAARQKEVATLSTDYLANMLRQGTPESQVAKMADEMGVSMDAVKAHLETGQDLYRQLELKMDVLHKRFLSAAGDPATQAQIAEEMAAIQGKLNAAVPGPYMTPGGGAKHVTHREAQLRPIGPRQALSPVLGYTALMDDYFMLQHALQDVGAEFTEKQAKAMAKYGDRLLITAGQYGLDMFKSNSRALWEDLGRILERARLEKKKPPLDLLQPKLGAAKQSLQGQLDELAQAVKKNAEDYLAQVALPAPKPSAVDFKAIRDMLTRSEQVIAKQIALIIRIQIRQSKEEGGKTEEAGSP